MEACISPLLWARECEGQAVSPHPVLFLLISCAQFPRYFGEQFGPSTWLNSPSH